MAQYRPDYKLKDSIEYVKGLRNDPEKNKVILYYIDNKNKRLDKLMKENHEYEEFFKQLNKLLPKTNKTLR